MKQATNKQLRESMASGLCTLDWETNRIDATLNVLFMLERELNTKGQREASRVVESVQLTLLDCMGELEKMGREQSAILKGGAE